MKYEEINDLVSLYLIEDIYYIFLNKSIGKQAYDPKATHARC